MSLWLRLLEESLAGELLLRNLPRRFRLLGWKHQRHPKNVSYDVEDVSLCCGRKEPFGKASIDHTAMNTTPAQGQATSRLGFCYQRIQANPQPLERLGLNMYYCIYTSTSTKSKHHPATTMQPTVSTIPSPNQSPFAYAMGNQLPPVYAMQGLCMPRCPSFNPARNGLAKSS
ncbi:uncharacterized protein EI97DRAFT_193440 [Westerdykella ornata]|uniref:Uncharacterized protein n=1 Tax=Westerdykella ornata TaxID=318751 RepID=A0A6A6J8Z6_WESOR|nr:uncharacterized protein EI97DRAFT_193440 [Westerdykella ornata]KAF2273051.1 hypothetical protein EI97DRAFT_193440 [Westerdykella ornata]